MKVAIGADHGGVGLKTEVEKYLEANGFEYEDFGTFGVQAVDYPEVAHKVARCVADGKADKGIIICGTGIGVSIVANKVPGIRCALLSDVFSAKATRQHNDANVMTMGGRTIGPGLAVEIASAFLNTEFSGDERHMRRIDMISDIEKQYNK